MYWFSRPSFRNILFCEIKSPVCREECFPKRKSSLCYQNEGDAQQARQLILSNCMEQCFFRLFLWALGIPLKCVNRGREEESKSWWEVLKFMLTLESPEVASLSCIFIANSWLRSHLKMEFQQYHWYRAIFAAGWAHSSWRWVAIVSYSVLLNKFLPNLSFIPVSPTCVPNPTEIQTWFPTVSQEDHGIRLKSSFQFTIFMTLEESVLNPLPTKKISPIAVENLATHYVPAIIKQEILIHWRNLMEHNPWWCVYAEICSWHLQAGQVNFSSFPLWLISVTAS